MEDQVLMGELYSEIISYTFVQLSQGSGNG